MSLRYKCTVLIKHTGTCISVLKVSARVKKEFLISRRSDKAFQELSFKKNSAKNITSVQRYWTLKFNRR